LIKKNPLNIINKGSGQQKEFIMNNYSLPSISPNQKYLIVDEIENSLPLNSLSKIINSFIKNSKKTQYFLSSHSPEILRLIKENLVTVINIGEKIPPISMLPKNTIFCEGKIDTLILKKIWIKYLFISGGGANLPLIVKQISEFEDNNISIKIIVDGDV